MFFALKTFSLHLVNSTNVTSISQLQLKTNKNVIKTFFMCNQYLYKINKVLHVDCGVSSVVLKYSWLIYRGRNAHKDSDHGGVPIAETESCTWFDSLA